MNYFMKITTLLMSVLISASALASTTTKIDCTFTEPFLSVEIDLQKKTAVRVEPDWENDVNKMKRTVISKNIQVVIDSSDLFLPKYKVNDSKGKLIMELSMNMNGSDGMSDITYPFSAVMGGDFWGGCVSNKIDWVNPHESLGL